MRVFQLAYSLDVGGLEQMVVQLCRGLLRRNVECEVGCLSHAGPLAELLPEPLAWIGQCKPAHRFLDAGTLVRLCRYLRQRRISVLHTHNPSAHLYGALVSATLGVPHLHTVHGRGNRDSYPKNRSRLRRLLTWKTNRVIAVSRDVESVLLQRDRLPRRKVSLIPNGTDTDRFVPVSSTAARAALRRKFGIPQDAFVLGSVGRLAPEKNYPLLVKAFTEFYRAGIHAHLVIVGDGPTRHDLQRAVALTPEPHRCSLPGKRLDVADWLQCFDLFVLPSDTEGTAVTLLEAMSCGIAVVATDVGGNREVVAPPRCGLIVPPNDAAALTAAFRSLYERPEQRLLMGEEARHRVLAHYSLEQMVEKYCDLYNTLLGR